MIGVEVETVGRQFSSVFMRELVPIKFLLRLVQSYSSIYALANRKLFLTFFIKCGAW